jgi:predicted Zn-dependent peptidase
LSFTINQFQFANGIRLLHKQVPSTQISHLGIMLDMGSRDETEQQLGLAHFWEHMAFKGTGKRGAFHILNRLETVGGELNAYTTKEKICFHASVLAPYTDRAIELLADITFNSVFPEKQVEREKGVILEEMAMYKDSPEDAIQDDFDLQLFPDHTLGNNILGTSQSVESFKREQLISFIGQHLDTSKVVLSITTPLSFEKVKRIAIKYLSDISTVHSATVRKKPLQYTVSNLTEKRAVSQAQVAMGRPAFGLLDPKRLPFFMLVNHLGGPAMNSRFNVSLREKNGLVYGIEASYVPYIDSGYFGIYFGTEPNKIQKSLSLIEKELKTLREVRFSENQLHVLKNQLKGQLAMAEESNMGFMQMMAKSVLDLGRIDTIDDVFSQIDSVNASTLQDIAQEMFATDHFSSLQFLPEKS